MKIAVIGFSGSGKSTLARKLGELTGAPVLHLDTVQFLPGWEIRPEEEKQAMVQDFLDANSAWVVDGNYRKLSFDRRLEEADQIWILLFNRFTRFSRVLRRYRKNRGQSRPDMARGCPEKVDAEFARWVLWDCCTPEKAERFRDVVRRYPEKSHLLENQRQVNAALQLFEERRL
ncbi:MAG: DNA topology modulation protein FlaR [Oscillospiraceae bacterium]|nr:DNA topology modulation protein FlaR [Oscillospiraceae bacterium]